MRTLIACILMPLMCHFASADELSEGSPMKKIKGEGRIYGAGQGWPSGYKDIPCGGNFTLIESLDKVALNIKNKKAQVKVVDVQIVDIAKFLNAQLPAGSGWIFKVEESVRGERMTGVISNDMLKSLVSLMSNSSIYCLVTDGVVEFRDAKKLQRPDPKDADAEWRKIPSPVWIEPASGDAQTVPQKDKAPLKSDKKHE